MKRTVFPILLAAVAGFFLRSAVASTPTVDPLTFTGRITQAGGTALPDGDRAVHVALRSGTTNVCETVVGMEPSVTFTDGRFAVPLPDCAATQVALHGDLEIQLNITGAGTLPWMRLGAVPYALEAKHADTATLAANATNATNAVNATNATTATTATTAANTPVVTDWNGFTPVVTAGGQAVVPDSVAFSKWRRVGNTAEIQVRVLLPAVIAPGGRLLIGGTGLVAVGSGHVCGAGAVWGATELTPAATFTEGHANDQMMVAIPDPNDSNGTMSAQVAGKSVELNCTYQVEGWTLTGP